MAARIDRTGTLALALALALSLSVGGAGCIEPEQVRLSGTVYSSADPVSPPLAGAALRFVDFEGNALGRATADADGAFELTLPAVSLFVEVSAEGYATSTFPGVLGLAPEQKVEDRTLFGTSLAEVDDTRARFAGCPGADAGGGMAVGQVRLFGGVDSVSGEAPVITAARASIRGAGRDRSACYLTPDGGAYDPAAELTGGTGLFAVFDLPAGVLDLVVESDFTETQVYPVWIPPEEAGGESRVSPWYPAYLELMM